jgi:hypothetical protein
MAKKGGKTGWAAHLFAEVYVQQYIDINIYYYWAKAISNYLLPE